MTISVEEKSPLICIAAYAGMQMSGDVSRHLWSTLRFSKDSFVARLLQFERHTPIKLLN